METYIKATRTSPSLKYIYTHKKSFNMKLQVLSVVLVLAIILVCTEAGPTRSRREDIDSASVEQDATDDSTQEEVTGEGGQDDKDCPEQARDMRRKKRCNYPEYGK